MFKWLFAKESHNALLISLLNAVLKLPKGHMITSVEVLNPFNDKESFDDKVTVLDIKARDQEGRLYNIEMQLLGTPILPGRLVYYWAVLHSEQLREGQNYSQLRPTITICFVDSVILPDIPVHHSHMQLRTVTHPKVVFSEHLSIHLIELPKFRRQAEDLLDPLDAWCYFLKHGGTMDTTSLPENLRNSPVEKAMEELNVFAQSDVERERYQSRLKAQRDYVSFVYDAEMRGREEGREEGRGEGIAIGRHVERIRMYQAFLKLPQTPESELATLSLADLAAIEHSLEQQMPSSLKVE